MANIFHIDRPTNTITLGTTGTTINVASHTASLSLGLDASKNLESVDLSAIYQPLDVVLTDLSALAVVADNEFIVGTGAGVYAHESGATARTSIGLGNVENTQLSTWAGSGNITTLGTIATVGNITIADDGTIGQSAGPLLTFDDTNNFLEISNCHLGIVSAASDTTGIRYIETFNITDNVEKFGITSTPMGQKTTEDFTSILIGVLGRTLITAENTQNWTCAPYGMVGVEGAIRTNVDSTGTITSAVSLLSRTEIWGALVTNIKGLFIESPTASAPGSITNAYGIYVGDVDVATTLNYAIYTNAGLVHFGDKVGIGITTPLAQLHQSAVMNNASVPTDPSEYNTIFNQGGSSGYEAGIGLNEGGTITGAILFTDEGAVGRTGMAFATGDINALTERVRLDYTGKFGIGVSDPHSKLEVNGAISSETLTITASADDTDVSGVNTVFINPASANVVIGGFTGGVVGQVLYVAITGIAFTTTLENQEGIGGSQDIYLCDESDDTLDDYGGWTLICNGTNWYDCGHAKHV